MSMNFFFNKKQTEALLRLVDHSDQGGSPEELEAVFALRKLDFMLGQLTENNMATLEEIEAKWVSSLMFANEIPKPYTVDLDSFPYNFEEFMFHLSLLAAEKGYRVEILPMLFTDIMQLVPEYWEGEGLYKYMCDFCDNKYPVYAGADQDIECPSCKDFMAEWKDKLPVSKARKGVENE